MANDRIFLKCRHCGKTKSFIKYYPSAHGIQSSNFYDFAKWINRHMECNFDVGVKMDLGGDRCFDLFTESDERFNDLYDPEIGDKIDTNKEID